MATLTMIWRTPELHVPRSRFNDFPRQYVVSTAASAGGASIGAGAAGAVGGSAATAAIILNKSIGLGRDAANAWVNGSQGQDAFLRDVLRPASILAQTDPQQASDLVSKAWANYLQAADTFAKRGPNEAKVIKQSLTTPAFIQTVQTLLGKNPLSSEYTQPFMAQTGANPNAPFGGSGLSGIIPLIAATLQGPLDATRIQGPLTTQAPIDDPNDPQGGINGPTATAIPPDIENAPPAIGAPTTTLPAATTLPGAATTPPIATPKGPGILSRIGSIFTGGGGSDPNASLLQKLLPSLISTIPGIVGSVVQSKAAGKAAELEIGAQNKAAELQAQSSKESLEFLKSMYAEQQKNLQPWLTSGNENLKTLNELMAPGGALRTGFEKQFTAPTADEITQDPGFQARLRKGTEALERSAAAKLGLNSGATGKRLIDYGQESASNEYQNVFGRKLTEYQQEQLRLQNEFNNFAGLSSQGLNAAAGANVSAGTFGTNAANLTTAQGNNAATTAENIGNIEAGAAANSGLGNVLAGVGSTIQNQLTLQQLLSAMRQSQKSAYAT